MNFLYEKHWLEFVVLTLALGGWASYMTGKAFAQTWRSVATLIIALIGLSLFLRFVHFAVFEGNLISLHYFLTDSFCLLAIGLLGFQFTRTKQMSEQYWWLYEKKSPFTYAKRQEPLLTKP